jgi:hypothetical protein
MQLYNYNNNLFLKEFIKFAEMQYLLGDLIV